MVVGPALREEARPVAGVVVPWFWFVFIAAPPCSGAGATCE